MCSPPGTSGRCLAAVLVTGVHYFGGSHSRQWASIIRIELLDVSDVAAAAIVTAKDLSTAGIFDI